MKTKELTATERDGLAAKRRHVILDALVKEVKMRTQSKHFRVKHAARLLDDAQKALKLHDELAAVRDVRVDYIGETVSQAAKELRAMLPKSFPTLADARCFAEKLPLGDARAQAVKASDERSAATKKITDAVHIFSHSAEQCAALFYTNDPIESLLAFWRRQDD